MTEGVAAHLKEGGVTVKPYDAMLDDVREAASSGMKLWTDPAKASFCAAALDHCRMSIGHLQRQELRAAAEGCLWRGGSREYTSCLKELHRATPDLAWLDLKGLAFCLQVSYAIAQAAEEAAAPQKPSKKRGRTAGQASALPTRVALGRASSGRCCR